MAAIPLLIITFPVAVFAGLLSRPRPKSPDALVRDIERFIEFAEGRREWDLDEFEAVALADPQLERIRMAAIKAGPPKVDLQTLRGLLTEAKGLEAAGQSPVPQ